MSIFRTVGTGSVTGTGAVRNVYNLLLQVKETSGSQAKLGEKKEKGEKEKPKPKKTPPGQKAKKSPEKAVLSRFERRAERRESGAPLGWKDLDSVRPTVPAIKSRGNKNVEVIFSSFYRFLIRFSIQSYRCYFIV